MRKICYITVLALISCAGPERYDDPIVRLMNKTEGHRVRWAAARQAEEQMWDDPSRVAALKRLVWEPGYPAEYSNYAVDQLIAIDEAEARRYLAEVLTAIRDDRTMQYVIDRAVERRWTDFVPALVRSYALRSHVYEDQERPERKAIEQLVPGKPVEQVIVDVFAGSTDADIKQRVAAWALLHRLHESPSDIAALLSEVESDDPLVLDLRAGAGELGVVPDHAETVTWLRVLRTEEHRPFWERAKEAVARLSPEQRQGLQLRHLPILVYLLDTQPEVLGETGAVLASEMANWVDAQEHYLKGPTYDGPMDEHPQELRQWRDTMVWADLAVMKVMTQLVRDRELVDAWFAQASQDNLDKSTEFGGLVLRGEDGKPRAQAYKPLVRRHDLKYLPPKQLVLDGYTALAHYHFHAQSLHNARYAGPGIGDLQRIARRQEFNGLVLTFIDEDRLNVDLYHSPEVVIDLGTIRRDTMPR